MSETAPPRDAQTSLLLVSHFALLVARGIAEQIVLDTGAVGLHLPTGEIFLLREDSVTRLA